MYPCIVHRIVWVSASYIASRVSYLVSRILYPESRIESSCESVLCLCQVEALDWAGTTSPWTVNRVNRRWFFFCSSGASRLLFAFASVHVYVPPSLSRARAPSPTFLFFVCLMFEVLFLDLGRSGSDRFGLARTGWLRERRKESGGEEGRWVMVCGWGWVGGWALQEWHWVSEIPGTKDRWSHFFLCFVVSFRCWRAYY